jgi:hypothetical protein
MLNVLDDLNTSWRRMGNYSTREDLSLVLRKIIEADQLNGRDGVTSLWENNNAGKIFQELEIYKYAYRGERRY